MPGQLTHNYTALRLAQEYADSANETLRLINTGCEAWLSANRTFMPRAEAAVNNHDFTGFLDAVHQYRRTLLATNDDSIAVFSAFATGSVGPDIWMVPDSFLYTATHFSIQGSLHFDLGHYNLSHRFPFTVLNRLHNDQSRLDQLQFHYQLAYILGYLSHIALDVLGHIMVNVTAGAYHLIIKEWENDQGNLTSDLFNLHNKTEHYLDAFVRHVLYEGYYPDFQSFNPVRSSHFGQDAALNFPNGRDFFGPRCRQRFSMLSNPQRIQLTEALNFLDLSTSLPGPFAHRYHRPYRFPQQVTPFIHHDYVTAYSTCVNRLRDHALSITHFTSERPKTDFFRFTNRGIGASQDYYLRNVIPEFEKVRDRISELFSFEGWGRFFEGGRLLAHEFIDAAVKFIGSGSLEDLSILRHWNLDIGLRYKIIDQSQEKPLVPVRIEIANVCKEVPKMAEWNPPVMDWQAWGASKEKVDWDDKPAKQPHYLSSDFDSLSGVSGENLCGIVVPQSGVELSVSTFKVYPDADELGAYIYGQQHLFQLGMMGSPMVLTEEPDASDRHPGYALPFCYEDFTENDNDTEKMPQETIGTINLQTYRASFYSPLPLSVPVGGDTVTSNFLMQESSRPLPRHIKISTARKFVCRAKSQANHGAWYDNDEGNFHPDKLDVCTMPFPTEEIAFALYAVVLRSGRYFDLFSHSEYSVDFLEQCKHIHSVGVNVILLIFDEVTGATPDDITLKLKEAFIDGEPETAIVENAPPQNIIRLFEIEDALFRLDSAVFLPERIASDEEPGEHADELEEQERITGIEMLKCIMIHAKEHSTEKMLIAGHTDTKGSPTYNENLSLLRAQSLLHLLTGEEFNKQEWAKLSHEKNTKDDKDQLLAWAALKKGWACSPEGQTLYQAVLAFQKAFNTEYTQTIGEDGDWRKETWGAFFVLYQDELAKALDVEVSELPSFRDSLNWLNEDCKAVGCGENWPIEHKGETNYECPVNRRVEVLFYEPGTEPALPLQCHSSAKQCTAEGCPVYGGDQPQRVHLPTHPDPRPQAQPIIYAPSHPDSETMVPLDNFYVYIAYYRKDKDTPREVKRCIAKEGKLVDAISRSRIFIDGGCDAWFYFSHRDDLYTLDKNTAFSKTGSGLPLVGPVAVPGGVDNRIDIDIWQQHDWFVMQHEPLDSAFADDVLMAEWNDANSIGRHYLHDGADGHTFRIYRSAEQNDGQQHWKGGAPVSLVKCETGTKWIWAGTLSYAPTGRIKILLLHRKGDEHIYAGSLNEIQPTGSNIIHHGHHRFNSTLVQQLIAIAADQQNGGQIDALPDPPARFILPGDICWHDQHQTNFCGTFSFAGAMNYWYPYTNNPLRKNGTFYSEDGNISARLDGSRTPDDIMSGVTFYNLNGRDNDCEHISRARAIKLVKSWLSAGVPVLILVAEAAPDTGLHWKILVGYDGNRIFMINSGMDRERILARRTPGIDYEHAPTGNDVDSEDAFYEKWNTVGFWTDLLTSSDHCTFIPIYPQEIKFGSDRAS